jgi:thioester reductase-like protein
VSDSDQYYDEELSLGSYPNSQESLDDSTDSTMELCADHSSQIQKREMPRLISQSNGITQSKQIECEVSDDDDIEALKSQKRQQSKQPQMKSQASQRFLPHRDPRSKLIKAEEKTDYDKPLNLRTISMLSPIEEDLAQRRVQAMSTHGIGFVVTKNGIDIRAADYHPTGPSVSSTID